MTTRNVFLYLLLGVLTVIAVAYAAPSKLLHNTNTDSLSSPGQVLYKDAIQVVDKIQDFLAVISEFEKVKLQEGDREMQIENYSIQRNKKDGGFKTSSWRRKRSTMEEELISAAYLEGLDNKAEHMISTIHTFLNDLQKVRQFYEGKSRSRGMRSSTTADMRDLADNTPRLEA